ncbi:MAG: trypsin-like peptidase domain-containing protein [Maritimibacter sp.]|nr:trypsin-like peptidase domain-containing protein [Maritimibacter sp.]
MKRVLSAILLLAALVTVGLVPTGARAQESFWVQLSANATLAEAEGDARAYAARLPEVNGFRLGNSGWYAVALGPYSAETATEKLIALRAQGAIPNDSYISDGAPYGQRFWPVGATEPAGAATPVEETAATVEPEPEPAPVAEPLPTEPVVAAPEPAPAPALPVPAEETREEALAAERALDEDGRKALQIALQWEGFYQSLIDGDFGPGTRGAMAAWQAAQGYEETGVLSSRQRAELMQGYNEVMASMGLAQVMDPRAGIEITLPTAMVKFTRYEAPFAHYEGDEGVRVVLISQRGDRATLWGLYDILQTLAVVPPEGPRKRDDASFSIQGENAQLISHTYAALVDGAVKGWMLIWPQGERVLDAETGAYTYEQDRRLGLVLEAMRTSFTSLGATALDDNAGMDDATQSIDLVSGLEIRRPEKSRSGFYVSDTGAVLTTTEAVESCGRITLDEAYDVDVAARDEALGLALLTPTQPLAPLAVAEFLPSEPRLQSELAVAGYSYGGRLSSPTLTYGRLADVSGLSGEPEISRLEIRAQDGDTGGPVIDQNGSVAGMLLASPSGDGRVLPTDVGFIAKVATLADFLAANGITAATAGFAGSMTPYELSGHAADLTVLVSCWD